MKPYLLLAFVLALAGCPGKNISIYRSLGEPGAMKTCDANQRFRAEKVAADAATAKAEAEAEIRSVVATNKGCGAFIFNEGSGKKLDGRTTHVADYQLCRCE
jgi:hypothetical protein